MRYGKCGVAVIRVSGPEARKAAQYLGGPLPQPRVAALKKFRDPVTNDVLDNGLLLWFPGPKSFTGEDCCEFQVHGGPAVLTSMLQALSKLENLRPAEPGEFTKRAFYSGKLDLTSVEGLADLINAETEMQRQQALFQMEGALYNIYLGWTRSLTKYLANIEAYIDFEEDQDFDSELMKNTKTEIELLCLTMKDHLKDGRRGERLRNGVNLTILGRTNVGKSTILNKLSKNPVAIVSPIPGTTRDIVRTNLDICGFPVNLRDTAGLRKETTDPIELEGINRAKLTAAESDLVLFVIDALDFFLWKQQNSIDVLSLANLKCYAEESGLDHEICESITGESSKHNLKQILIVVNKIDLLKDRSLKFPDNCNVCIISCKEEIGIDKLVENMSDHLKILCASPNKMNPSYTQARHRHCIQECIFALNRFLNYNTAEIDLAAQEVRNALYNLGKITGQVTTEDVLDVIFKDFCIGK